MILAAAIAFVTLRSDPIPSTLSTVTDGTTTGTASGDSSQTNATNATDASQPDTTAATADDQSADGTQAQPASIPRPTVQPPVIVGIVNGRITYIRDGAPAPDVIVELFASDDVGTLGDVVVATRSDTEGRYGFDVDDGCYVAVFSAPEGFAFPGVGETLNGPPVCVSQESPFSLGASLEAVE